MRTRIVVCLAFVAACALQARPVPYRFDSASSVALDGHLESLVLRTRQTEEAKVRDEILTQLFYLAGALNHHKSGAELGHADIRIEAVTPVAGTELREVRYSAKFIVGWTRQLPVPAGLRLVFPAQVDEAGLQSFFRAYGKTCSESAEDPDLEAESFYYYFRPENEECSLFKVHAAPEVASYGALNLKPSGQQTEGKYPEYDRVWADGKLVATAIFGKNKAGATSNKDAGIHAYNEMYSRLRQRFGRPDYANVNLKPKAQPGVRHPDIEMEWTTERGRVNVNILLVDKHMLTEVSPEFAARYNQRTRNSDFVSYNGHSGFGANIRALAKMGTFLPGQWQLYLVNGCDTFFYVDDSLRAAHEAVNPGTTPYAFFDIITNALPVPFAVLAQENMLVIDSFIAQRSTYRQLLSGFHGKQHAIVAGEEDNRWTP